MLTLESLGAKGAKPSDGRPRTKSESIYGLSYNKEINMNDAITIKQFAFENNIKPRTMPTRLRLAADRGMKIYPVGKEGKANLYTRNDLTKINATFAKNKNKSTTLTRLAKKVKRPDVAGVEDDKSMAKVIIIKTNARTELTNAQWEFLVESLFERV